MRALRATDPLGPVLALVAAVVYALAGWTGVLNRDLGLFVYGGQRFLAGEPPYSGVFNRVGPLADIVPGIGIGVGRVIGLGDIHAVRLWYLALSALCVWLLYVVARDVLGSRPGAVVACATFLCFETFTELAGNGPRDKTAMLVFLLAALLAAQRSWWWALGSLTALATLTWQPAFVPLTVLGISSVVAQRQVTRPLVAAGGICLAGLATTLVFGIYFWLEDGLGKAIDGFLLVNLTDNTQPSPIKNPGYVWQFLTNGYGWSLALVLVGLVVALLCLVPRIRRWVDLDAGYVTVGLSAAAAVAWSLYALNGPPDLFVVLPFAAIGVAILALPSSRLGTPIPVVVLTVALVGAAGLQSWSLRDDTLVAQKESVAALLQSAPPGATILSVEAPQALAIAGRRNPTPYQVFSLGFDQYVEDSWPGGMAGYASWVRTSAPEIIVIGDRYSEEWIDSILRDGYRRVGTAPRWFWFASTDLPPERLRELREALGE
jgi:hypothetical protein